MLVLAVLVLTGCSSNSSTPEVSQPKKPEELTSSQNLIKAKEHFETINSNLNLGKWTTYTVDLLHAVRSARAHIEAIGKNDPEYTEAQELYRAIDKRIQLAEEDERVKKRNFRKQYAQDLQHEMLMKGYNYYVSVGGKNNEILFIKYVLVGRVWCTQFANSPLEGKLSGMGFEKVVMDNGYDYKITWNSVKQKWEY